MYQGCIAKHFQQYALLSPQDIQLLESLEEKPEMIPRGTKLWSDGSESSHFYVLLSGWAYSSRILQNGSRQVLEVFVPGDVIGLRELAYRQRLTPAHTVTDARLCAFPEDRLPPLFESSGLLGQILFALAAQGQSLLLERVTSLGRRSARQRVAHLLAELSVRLERSPAAEGQTDVIPLSQTLLADLLGLSAVHINRTIRALREEGLIDLQYQTIRLLDVEGLKEVAGFNPDYLSEVMVSLLSPGQPPAAGSTDAEISFRPVDSSA